MSEPVDHQPAPIGVVVMAYGTPATLDDLEAYYTHIRRGRPPTAEQVEDLRSRYEAIGGISPLRERTEAQRSAIQRSLDEAHGQGRFVTALGQKHASPFIEDAVEALATAGADAVVGLVLAPHYAKGSVGQYLERAAEACAARDLAFAGVSSWADEPAFLDFLAGAVEEAAATLPEHHHVLFTAHSLPERVLEGDPYPDELAASAQAVAERSGLPRYGAWGLAWQSAGRTPEPWRGPDVLEVIRELAATGRSEGVLVCPQGFTADHLEVLYDLDIEAARVAEEVGLAFARTRSINDDPAVMASLAGIVAHAADAFSGRPADETDEEPDKADKTEEPDKADKTEEPDETDETDEPDDESSEEPEPIEPGEPDEHVEDAVPAAAPAPAPADHDHVEVPRAIGRVVVIGAGIAGLTAAHTILSAAPDTEVTILEASDRVGGKLRTEPVGDEPDALQIDAGADAMLARVPQAAALCQELGLDAELTSPATGSAFLWLGGALVRLPEGLMLGVPTDLDAVEAAGILTDAGLARLREETDQPEDRQAGDATVGEVLRPRIGDEAFERLAAPLLAGVNAGDADRLSLDTGAPQLAAALREHGSLLAGVAAARAAAATAAPGRPVFHGLTPGMGRLPAALLDAVTDAGATVHLDTTATAVTAAHLPGRARPVYTVHLDEPHGHSQLLADAVVVACPAATASRVLAPVAPPVAAELGALDYASVVVVTVVLPRAAVGDPLEGSGFLTVPPGFADADPQLFITACSYSSSKWQHVHDMAPDRVVLRVSAGRAGDPAALALTDAELADRVFADLRRTIGLDARVQPTSPGVAVRVTRWPDGLPQFTPGHLDRVAASDRWLAQHHPALAVVGASRTGLGIPACIVRAQTEARRLLLGAPMGLAR